MHIIDELVQNETIFFVSRFSFRKKKNYNCLRTNPHIATTITFLTMFFCQFLYLPREATIALNAIKN